MLAMFVSLRKCTIFWMINTETLIFPNVRWLMIASYLSQSHLFGKGSAKLSNCQNCIYTSHERLAVWIFPFVDTETFSVNESLAEEIDKMERMTAKELLFFNYKVIKGEDSSSKISKKILPTLLKSDKYRSVVVQIAEDTVVGHNHVHTAALNHVIVMNPTSLPLYRKKDG